MQGIQTSAPLVVTDLVEEVVQFILIMCPALEESLPYWTVSKMTRKAMLLHTALIIMMLESDVLVRTLCIVLK